MPSRVSDSSIRGEEEIFLVVRTRSIFACLLHWVLFCAVVTLAITGYYIGNPIYYFGKGEAYQAFAMADIRTYHFIAATVLIMVLFTRFYLSFTASCNRDIKKFLPTPKNVVNALKLAYYFTTGKGEHGHYRFINPLGGLGIFMMSLVMAFMALSGFLLYLPARDPDFFLVSLGLSFANSIGGLQFIRLLHHTAMYGLIFVVVIHVYMQIWKNTMFTESDISSIIGGYKIFPYSQIGHFADIYGLVLDEIPPSIEGMESESKSTEKPPG
jgi:Ni/Fe-hydrogenase 1 B-type cytochrome subunit